MDILQGKCRTCNTLPKKDSTNITVKEIQMLHELIPDMNLFSELDIICRSCANYLKISYHFKNKCLETDKIYKEIYFNMVNNLDENPNEILPDSTETMKPETDGLPESNDFNAFLSMQDIENDNEGDLEVLDISTNDLFDESFDLSLEEPKLNSKTFNCSVCEVFFQSLQELVLHSQKHKPCPICGKIFKLDLYEDHVEICRICHIKCMFCPQYFSTTEESLKHFESVHESMKCELCGIVAAEFEELNQHLLEMHRKETFCEHCSILFYKVENKEAHFKKLHAPFFCAKCDVLFKEKIELKRHNTERHRACRKQMKAVARSYKCKQCPKFFYDFKLYRQHLTENHMQLKKEIKTEEETLCDICGKSVASSRALSTHKMVHTPAVECPLCHKQLPNKLAYYTHKKFHKNRQERQCPDCGKKFISRMGYINHLEMHTTKHRTHVCDECPSKFFSRVHLVAHKNTIHAAIKKFVCKLCGRSYARLDHYKMHVKRHEGSKSGRRSYSKIVAKTHQGTVWKVYDSKTMKYYQMKTGDTICPICLKTSKSYSALLHHVKIHDVRYRQYQCQICHLAFSLKHMMERHMLVHKGNKFRCNVCYKKFDEKEKKDLHESTHSIKVPHECDKCSKIFARKFLLENHIFMEHSQDLVSINEDS